MTDPTARELVFDLRENRVIIAPSPNAFDRSEIWIGHALQIVFWICAIVSGFATFSGIDLFLDEIGSAGLLSTGTSIILTIAITAILVVGWGTLYRYGPEARTVPLKLAVIGLAKILLVLTLCVSSLPNLMALVGPAAKVHDWRLSHARGIEITNAVSNRALAIGQLRPGWEAANQSACRLASGEEDGGQVSGVGGGVGPVSVALTNVCAQTKAFLEAIDASVALVRQDADQARDALAVMRSAIRDRSRSVILREDQFLDGGDALNAAIQNIRAADLTGVLEAGARQVEASIAELSEASAFNPRQVEMVSAIKEGLQGLVIGTREISAELSRAPLPEDQPMSSPDFISAIMTHSGRFIPVFAAAMAIDFFMIWSLLLVLTLKAGKAASRLRGQFDGLIETDTLAPLPSGDGTDAPKSARRQWFGRKTNLN